jgi:D-glycero-alpha-D-manno-heptose-7-phosphate kinase
VPPNEIESRFVLAYTGAPRQSGINNWEVFQAHVNGDARVTRNFDQIGEIARGMHEALAGGEWRRVASLLRAEWKLRRTNAPGISTPLIERLIAAASQSGAVAAKVCGAGGGGCVIFLSPPEKRLAVADAVQRSGGRLLPFQVARDGVTVVGARG